MSEIKLYLGDCLEVMNDIPDNSVDLVLCDLPYYNVVSNKWDNQWNSVEDYLSWCNEVITHYRRIIKEQGNIILFTSRQLQHNIANLLDKYFIEQRVIIWKRKRNFNQTRGKTLSSEYEPITWYSVSEKFTFNNIKLKVDSNRKEYTMGVLKDGITMSDVWDIPAIPHNSKEKVDHPTQKPIRLIERAISLFSNENDVVLDNCMGSGTTGVACIHTKRNFIGIEKEEKYFEIAKKRIDDERKSFALWE